jgi:hypothetical protein
MEAIDAVEESVDNIGQFAVIVAEMKAKIEGVAKLPTAPSDDSSEEKPGKTTIIDKIKGVIPDSIKNAIPGCSGVVGGIAGGVAALGVAAVALLKKKEDKEDKED